MDVAITEQLFGSLYTCNKCRAMYFINFDGQAEFGDIAIKAADELPALNTALDTALDINESNDSVNNLTVPDQVYEGFESSLEPLIDSIDVVSFDNKLDEQFGDMEPQLESQLEPQLDSQVIGGNNLISSNDLFTDIAKEITDFGNTEVQLANLNYDLKISGLDTQDLQKLFKEAIEDSKFAWDANEIMRNIKNGQILFEKLNPVKAYILAKRLQFLDLEKQWTQNAIS